jgi:hypothetical protein
MYSAANNFVRPTIRVSNMTGDLALSDHTVGEGKWLWGVITMLDY